MRIAYLILAHRYPAQLARLIDRLRVDGATQFLVHADRRGGAEMMEPLRSTFARPDVHPLPRSRIRWGGFGIVTATLTGLRAMAASQPRFDYAALLTGQDYPIRPKDVIERTLYQADGRSLLRHDPLPRSHWGPSGGLERVERWHLRLPGLHLQLPSRLPGVGSLRRIPGEMRPYGGGAYWCLARDHVRELLRIVDETPGLLRFFRLTANADELFFHTILANSRIRDQLINASPTYTDWSGGGSHPADLTAEHLPTLRSADALFARKFDEPAHPGLLDRVDEELLAAPWNRRPYGRRDDLAAAIHG